MASAQEIANRWIDNATGENDRILHSRNYSNVYYEGDTIFSYGAHFAMGIIIRSNREPARGWSGSRTTSYVRTTGEPELILLNGDSFSPSTTQHQSAVRAACANSNLETIIVPFTALEAARIDPASIHPLGIRPDRNEEIVHRADSNDKRLGEPAAGGWEGDDYNREVLNSESRVLAGGKYGRAELVSVLGEPAEWRWATHRHWLGDSFFAARCVEDRTLRRYISSFDYQESRPLYFLCELPRTGKAASVEEAIELLKPPNVKQAIEEGREITRQGDIFAIPTNCTTNELKKLHTPYGKGRIVKRPRFGVLDTNHTASEVIFATGGRIYARGLLYHVPPGGRMADHARRKMGDGKTWHLLTRNTVPRQRTETRNRTEVA